MTHNFIHYHLISFIICKIQPGHEHFRQIEQQVQRLFRRIFSLLGYSTENVSIWSNQMLGMAKWIWWKWLGTEGYNDRARNLCFGKERSEEIGVECADGKSGGFKEYKVLMKNCWCGSTRVKTWMNMRWWLKNAVVKFISLTWNLCSAPPVNWNAYCLLQLAVV